MAVRPRLQIFVCGGYDLCYHPDTRTHIEGERETDRQRLIGLYE